MAERLRRDPLPPPWNYAVTADGRIFFINDKTQRTTWLHPVTDEPVETGMLSREDLPKGWQQAKSIEGAIYFVDHNEETTSFYHPTSSNVEVEKDSKFHVKLPQENEQNTIVTASPTRRARLASDDNKSSMVYKAESEGSTPATPKVKNRVIPKNVAPQVKRRKDDTVTMKGWLHKMGSKLKAWKKVWCVISDFCLFYYKGPNDVNMQGSIVLPSYEIKLVDYADKATKKYAFKCCHKNMRTVIFAAETQEDMRQWMEALSKAAKVQMDLGYGESVKSHKKHRISDDEDGGFTNFSQPTQSEIDHNRLRRDKERSSFEEDERSGSGYDSRNEREYGRPISYQGRPNGYERHNEVDNHPGRKNNDSSQRNYRDGTPPRHEVAHDDSVTEESNKYSDNDIEEAYSEEIRRNKINKDYSLSRDKDYRRLGTQPHTPGLYPVSYRTLPRKRSSDYYSSTDDFTWEEHPVEKENQEIQRSSVHDLRSPVHRQDLHYSDESYSSQEQLGRNREASKRQPTRHSDSYRHQSPSKDSHKFPDSFRVDRRQPDNYQRGSDPDRRSATLQYSRESLRTDNSMPHRQENRQYSSRESLPLSHLSSPSNAEILPNYKRTSNHRQDDSDSQNSRDSQRRDGIGSRQSYHSDSGNRSLRTSPPNKDYVDRGHNLKKRPDNLKFDFKHNNNYQIQQNGLSSPEQRSALQSPWVQDPPLLKEEQRPTINSPVTYNPPRPENDSQPLRDGQLEFKSKSEYPEQRSYLQSPMVQSNVQPSLTSEQRSAINSPVVYDGDAPQWPSQSMIDHRKMNDIKYSERITPKKTSSQHMAPNLSRSSTLESKRPPSQSRPSSRSGYIDETDIAPTRNDLLLTSPPFDRSVEDVRNAYKTEENLSRQSSRAGDHWERDRSAAPYYKSQNGSRNSRDSTPTNIRHIRKSSGYDSYGEDSKVEGRNRSGYSPGNRDRAYHQRTQDYVPHSQMSSRQLYRAPSHEASIRSGQLPADRHRDYIPHDNVRKQRKADNQRFDDDISSDSSSQQPERRRPQQENKITPSKQNYTQSSPSKRRPDSMIRAMEEKGRQSRSSSRRTTQEIFESEGADQFPAMEDKTEPRTTNRFRKWQQKLQPYIILNTGTRVRLSISADDLLGKPHEELVLLLIQLRRDQANLRTMNQMIRTEMTKLTDPDLPEDSPTKARARRHSLKNPSQDFTEEEMYLLELNQQKEEVENEIEISGPLVSLVDNLVRMGSLYGGQNEMLAQQYYRDEVKKGMSFKPPKKLIEFSRSFQEQRLTKDLEKELDELETVEDRELEDKLSHLHFLDTRLQEISVHVTDLKEDKDKIERALGSLSRQSRSHWDDPEAMERINEQQYRLERDLVKVREELAYRTKELESITAENNRIEHEVKLLRSKMEDAKKRGSQSEADEMKKTRMQIEKELQHVQGMIAGLENQKNALASQMAGIRNNKNDHLSLSSSRTKFDDSESNSSYTVTDLDSMQSYDITDDALQPSSKPPPVLERKESIGRVKELKMRQMTSREDPIQQRHSTPVLSSQVHELSPAFTPLRIETNQNNLHPYNTVNGTPSSLLTTSNTSSGSPAAKDKKQTVRMRKRESERKKDSDVRKKRSSSASGRRSGTFDIRYDYKPKTRTEPQGLRRTASMPDRKSLMGEHIVPTKQYTEGTDCGIVSDSELEPKHFSQDLDLRDFQRAMITADDEEVALQRSSSEHVLNSVSTEEMRNNDESSGSLLGPPPKILIPERYNPLSDDGYEEMTEEEKMRRSERAEGIKKMLSSHSLQEWHPREFMYDWQETTENDDEEMEKIRQGLKNEKEKRENILQMKADLAEEIKQHTKLIGAQSLKVSPYSGGEVQR
ncbi:uncharacterized protein [Antedon mediterranea]|uniref:uncharacterized protein n=1 Tax=Antedon mediterranea TaxID=105859 RepID=UPI003AF5C467